MFHPIEPYFLRSYTIEWKNESPKSRDFQEWARLNLRSKPGIREGRATWIFWRIKLADFLEPASEWPANDLEVTLFLSKNS